MSEKQKEQNALMPCPFCGDENATFVIKGDKRYARCGNKKCGAVIEAPALESVIANWNRRKPKWTKVEYIDDENDEGEPIRFYLCVIPEDGQQILIRNTTGMVCSHNFRTNGTKCSWDAMLNEDIWWTPLPLMETDT